MDIETSYTETHKEHGAMNMTSKEEPGPAHEALSLVLPYLPLLELLAMAQVCSFLRETVNGDVLLWLDLVVERPLNLRITDEVLMKIACMADRRLRTLALVNCEKITDDGLLCVVEKNPLIEKLYVPSCTGLSPHGVLQAVATLSSHNHHFKSLKVNGLYNINKEHLEALHSFLQVIPSQNKQHPILFHGHQSLSALRETDRPLDVELCPKCNEVRLVFDCPREACKRKKENPLIECRGCYFCIPRCEKCGVCVEIEEMGEVICGDFLCSDCWLKSPKCDYCNKPYCSAHADQGCTHETSGFVCGICVEKSEEDWYD